MAMAPLAGASAGLSVLQIIQAMDFSCTLYISPDLFAQCVE
jgi:hypothetical protein